MKRALQVTVLLSILALILVQCKVIWRSPKAYISVSKQTLQPPIVSLDEYTTSGLINTHARPYVYLVESRSNKGAVLVFGAEHVKDPGDKQFSIMEEKWKGFNPTVALVEGRLGFLFSWVQNPIKTLGEGGLTAKMAKANGVKLYSWEPGRDAEIKYLLEKFDRFHVAAFFCLRPYRSNYSGLTEAEQNKVMADLISERTSHEGINGAITSVKQIDSLWKADYPELISWRTYKHPQNGWPEGQLKQMAQEANSVRDEHLCQSIIELVKKGERVFVSMGASHAPRIEGTLRGMIH